MVRMKTVTTYKKCGVIFKHENYIESIILGQDRKGSTTQHLKSSYKGLQKKNGEREAEICCLTIWTRLNATKILDRLRKKGPMRIKWLKVGKCGRRVRGHRQVLIHGMCRSKHLFLNGTVEEIINTKFWKGLWTSDWRKDATNLHCEGRIFYFFLLLFFFNNLWCSNTYLYALSWVCPKHEYCNHQSHTV